MDKKIRISVTGVSTCVELEEFQHFQGDLKTLHKDQYEDLRASILKYGFFLPIAIWVYKGAKKILDGHQRINTLTKMQNEEGYHVPALPVFFIEAETEELARRILLQLVQQHGKINKDGLHEYVELAGITPEELLSSYTSLPGIDSTSFVDEFYHDNVDPLDVGAGDPTSEDKDSPGPQRHHSQNVRMVQLFFNDEDHGDFERLCEELSARYGKDNLTDTVLQAVRVAHENG